MAAMRMLSRAEFYAKLEKNGFTITTQKTAENTYWLHSETQKHYAVPHYMDSLPDAILDEYLQVVDRLYQGANQKLECAEKSYGVTEKGKKPHLEMAK